MSVATIISPPARHRAEDSLAEPLLWLLSIVVMGALAAGAAVARVAKRVPGEMRHLAEQAGEPEARLRAAAVLVALAAFVGDVVFLAVTR